MVDCPFHICTDFISLVPVACSTDSAGIHAQVLFRVNINHASGWGFCTRVFTVALAMVFASFRVFLPAHFGTYKLKGWNAGTQVGCISFRFHRKRRIMRAAWDAIFINGEVRFPKAASCVERDVRLIEMNAMPLDGHTECFTGQKIFVYFNLIKGRITKEYVWQDLGMFIEKTSERRDEEF